MFKQRQRFGLDAVSLGRQRGNVHLVARSVDTLTVYDVHIEVCSLRAAVNYQSLKQTRMCHLRESNRRGLAENFQQYCSDIKGASAVFSDGNTRLTLRDITKGTDT